MRRLLDFLRIDDIPLLTRVNYLAELQQMTLWGAVAGAVEGSLASIIASKTFDASRLLTTIIWALPVLMNILNLGWGSILRGRRRKPAFFIVATCGLIAVGSIGLTPAGSQPWNAWIFAAQIGCTHLFLSGLITLRTTMWKVNYPTSHRARIAGRLQTLRLLLTLITASGLSLVFNKQPDAYRLLYPFVAVVGALSLWPLRRLRMRGERSELRQFREHVAQRNGGDDRPRLGLRAGLREASTILRTDKLFAKYMLSQFLLGAANFFTDPILVNALTKDLRFDYFSAQAILFLIPSAALLGSIRFWAPYFDRIGVLRFRIYNSACWVLSYAGISVAMVILTIGGREALPVVIPILVVGRLFNGLGRGGGAIAWNLGHLHFAGEHQTELYMGIHVGLTGLRGLLMPLLGLGATMLFGYPAILIALGLAATAHIMFRQLAASEQKRLSQSALHDAGGSPPGDDAS